ncbi:hypothetical protein [uncultured Brevundimonas sp.]|uniref:hypothetical protein n=1 Tax=uncultured Brevundimonas sp. TaxID=213418 RepID=UPI0030EF756C
MITHRALFAGAFVILASLATGGVAAAQAPYGHIWSGSPRSEVNTRAYVRTGHAADGYSFRYYPSSRDHRYHVRPLWRSGPETRAWRDRGGRYGYSAAYGHNRSGARPAPGYRDRWGYDDDRPPVGRSGRGDRHRARHDGWHACGCADVYLYDR